MRHTNLLYTTYNFHFNLILLVRTGLASFGFIDAQYLQNVVFSIEIGLNGPNHSSTDFRHPMKKSLPSPKFPTSLLPPLGREISPLPL